MDVQAKIMAARFGIQFEEPIAGMVACQYALSPSNVPDTVLAWQDSFTHCIYFTLGMFRSKPK